MPYQPGLTNTASQSIANGNTQALQAMLALIQGLGGASSSPSPAQGGGLTNSQGFYFNQGLGPVSPQYAAGLDQQIANPMQTPNWMQWQPQPQALLQGGGYRPNIPPAPQHSSY